MENPPSECPLRSYVDRLEATVTQLYAGLLRSEGLAEVEVQRNTLAFCDHLFSERPR